MQELIIDNFAGAGGASRGIESALGRSPNVAINHDPLALEIHAANHPHTLHLCGNIWDYEPLAVTKGHPVGLMWASPDCKHFSRAKGGKPVSPRVRGLAWVVTRWARDVKPRVIILENVSEFQTWGPLLADSTPCPKRKGQTFRRWVAQLEQCGYVVEWRELVAADYGVPTTRKRLFLIARCDGKPIVWPERTHAPRDKATLLGLKPWRPAADCIDWTIPCPSIFERKRPLAEATLRRIANGIRRFVTGDPDPFIVTCNHGGPGGHVRSVYDTPKFCPHGCGKTLKSDLTCSVCKRPAYSVISPSIVRCAHGEESASGKRWGKGEHSLPEPLPTMTASKDYAVIAPHLVSVQNASHGGTHDVCSAFLAKHYGGVTGHSLNRPIGTVTQVDHHSLVTTHLTKLYGTCKAGQDAREPMPTITSTGQHIAEVRAFLVSYYTQGSGKTGHSIKNRAPTITTKDRLGLVTIKGTDYQIVDIGLRMLTPAELLRAQFGRLADGYILLGTKSRQVAAIGNSVCPELAEALVRSNVKMADVKEEDAA
jgi:DNA (cytosine-5)-methyltransferase 1